MISESDIKYRTVLFITPSTKRSLSVTNGELLLTEENGDVMTKISFRKILAVFIAGKCTITSPLLEAFTRHAIPLCLMKQSLRPVLWHASMAEGNYLLRQRQYNVDKNDVSIAKVLVHNKIENQIRLMERIPSCGRNLEKMVSYLKRLQESIQYEELMAIEAHTAQIFFKDWFRPLGWDSRQPRIKSDPVNVALDIGYTVLFNFIEANLRFFGFDLYKGIYHRLFFQRKSLVCDLMEPFRCIIDKETLEAFKDKRFRKTHFAKKDNQYKLKEDKSFLYWKEYAEAIVGRKTEVFHYIRNYYRAFMKEIPAKDYPKFLI